MANIFASNLLYFCRCNWSYIYSWSNLIAFTYIRNYLLVLICNKVGKLLKIAETIFLFYLDIDKISNKYDLSVSLRKKYKRSLNGNIKICSMKYKVDNICITSTFAAFKL